MKRSVSITTSDRLMLDIEEEGDVESSGRTMTRCVCEEEIRPLIDSN